MKKTMDMLVFTNKKDWITANALDGAGWALLAMGAGLIFASNVLAGNSQDRITETEAGKGMLEKIHKHVMENLSE